jgi:HlyD family secretion protein
LADAQTKYARAQQLAEKQLLPQSDLDTAKVAVDSARAELQSSQAQLVQAQAVLNQSQVNLEHTTITAPIDGTVIQRSVDVGQTVAASLSSPTIFIIAADLTKMQVSASVDEADIGQIQSGQPVAFSVDAYPSEPFTGTVSQVRLQATVVSNVTTYTTIIDVPNAAQKLKPGMTATVRIEIAQRSEALRVPNAALRFRPTSETFQALHQAPPASLPSKAASLAPGTAQLWTLVDGALTAVPVRTGISDGTNTEVLADAGLEGAQVVTAVTTGSGAAPSTKSTAGATNNPLMGTRQGPPR